MWCPGPGLASSPWPGCRRPPGRTALQRAHIDTGSGGDGDTLDIVTLLFSYLTLFLFLKQIILVSLVSQTFHSSSCYFWFWWNLYFFAPSSLVWHFVLVTLPSYYWRVKSVNSVVLYYLTSTNISVPIYIYYWLFYYTPFLLPKSYISQSVSQDTRVEDSNNAFLTVCMPVVQIVHCIFIYVLFLLSILQSTVWSYDTSSPNIIKYLFMSEKAANTQFLR